EPRHTHEERRQVVAVIPGLVKQLAVGMKAAGVDDEERSKFFAELMKLHRQAITAPGEVRPDDALDEAAAAGGPAAEGHPAGVHTAGLDLDFSESVTVKNPFGEGEVNVSSLDLDFTAFESGKAPTRGAAINANAVEHLVVGMWVEFRDEDLCARRPGK